MALLDVRELSVRFGGVVALDRVSFTVDAGEVVALIRPTGAGKTTLFNVITRVYRPTAGSVLLDGEPVSRMPAHHVIRHGLARTFQNVALFRSMTVLENVIVGDHIKTPSGWLESTIPTPRSVRAESAARKRAMEMIEFVGLGGGASRPVAILPFGTQKRVELARALVSKPRLLLLDEPAGGISHSRHGQLSPITGPGDDPHAVDTAAFVMNRTAVVPDRQEDQRGRSGRRGTR
jgi:branched-chain amino acid transport system ATP-binding protein